MTKTAPEVGQTRPAETAAGTRLTIYVTAVEVEGPNGWEVWGYRTGKSTLRRHKTTSYPNRYFIPKAAVIS